MGVQEQLCLPSPSPQTQEEPGLHITACFAPFPWGTGREGEEEARIGANWTPRGVYEEG